MRPLDTELRDVIDNVGSPLYGIVGRWRKIDDTWLIVLQGIDPDVDYTGETVTVKSKNGTKQIILGGLYNTFGTGAHYFPNKEA